MSEKQQAVVDTGAAVSVNAAIAEAVERMREEEERLRGEVARLNAELATVQRARVALERGNRAAKATGAGASVGSGSMAGRLRAPRGYLPRRILEVVGNASEPLARAQIIEELRESGYEFTLAAAAVTRELVALVKARRLKREGADNAARYVVAARGKRAS